MAERVIAVELQVNTGDSSQQLESVKTQLEGIEDEVRNVSKATRESQAAASFDKLNKVVDESVLSIQELGTAADNYKNIAIAAGVTSPIGQQALQRAAELENEMDRLNQTVAQVAEGGRALNTAMQLGTGIVAGYSAFQGVTALLGVENEDLQKTFVKLQAAQATLMGVKELAISLDRKGLLMTQAQAAGNAILTASTVAYNAVIGTSTGLMKVFRIALASTGIGLLVVGVGLLIANFDKLQKGAENLVDWFGTLGSKVTRLIEWYNELGVVGKTLAVILTGPVALAVEAYQFFFGTVEKGTADLMDLEDKRKKELREADADLKRQHGARIKEIQEQRDATIKASNEKIDALKLQIDTNDALGISSSDLNLQLLEETFAQTQAVLDANRQKLDSWVKYYTDQAALRGQNEEEFKASMKAQGVDLDMLQGKFNAILKDNENAVKYSENAITKFKREQNEARSKDLKEAVDLDIITQLDYQKASLNTFTEYNNSMKDEIIFVDEDLYDEAFDNLELQAEEALTKFETFVAGVSHLFKEGTESIPDSFAAMFEDIASGVDMAMETFSAVNDALNELGDRRSKKIAQRASNDLKALDEQKKRELNREGLTANEKLAIDKKFAMQQYEIELKAAKAQDEIAKKQFNRDKALKLAEIGINTASAIVKGIAQFGPPPSPLGIAAITSAGLIGGIQAAIVASSKFEGSAGSISPPSFDIPNVDTGGDTNNNGQNNGGRGQNNTTTETDPLLNPPPIIISQVEINRVQNDLARIEDVSVL